jgi:hypothetical protein
MQSLSAACASASSDDEAEGSRRAVRGGGVSPGGRARGEGGLSPSSPELLQAVPVIAFRKESYFWGKVFIGVPEECNVASTCL